MADNDSLAKLASVYDRLACKKCGSTNIGKDPKFRSAVVQQISRETEGPIGKPTTFYIFKCLDCGKEYYLEKYEVSHDS